MYEIKNIIQDRINSLNFKLIIKVLHYIWYSIYLIYYNYGNFLLTTIIFYNFKVQLIYELYIPFLCCIIFSDIYYLLIFNIIILLVFNVIKLNIVS